MERIVNDIGNVGEGWHLSIEFSDNKKQQQQPRIWSFRHQLTTSPSPAICCLSFFFKWSTNKEWMNVDFFSSSSCSRDKTSSLSILSLLWLSFSKNFFLVLKFSPCPMELTLNKYTRREIFPRESEWEREKICERKRERECVSSKEARQGRKTNGCVPFHIFTEICIKNKKSRKFLSRARERGGNLKKPWIYYHFYMFWWKFSFHA